MHLRRVVMVAGLLLFGLLLINTRSLKPVGADSGTKIVITRPSALAAQHALDRQRKASAAAQGIGTNLTVFQRIVAADQTLGHLSHEQIEAYLVRNKTNAASLLSVWLSGGGKDYIKQAAALYPDDPRVQLAVLNMNIFPEQQREWLDRLKQSDPDNSMGNYLSARDYLINNHPELALKELSDAAGKPKYEDYTTSRLQDLEELQMESGHSIAEAKAIAMASLLYPQLGQLNDLSRKLGSLEQNYINAGDTTSAEQIAKLGEGISRELSAGKGGPNLGMNQMIGLAMEQNLLKNLPAGSQPDFLGMSVQQRLDQIAEQRDQTKALTPLFDQMIARGNEIEIIGFFDRMKLNGGSAALQWLVARNSGQ